MPRTPWQKWYWSDWRGDPRLKLVSWEAGRLWFEMCGYMHEGEPYGYLRMEGRALDGRGIAALLGQPPKRVERWLAELVDVGIPGIDGNGCYYSRRMVRDEHNRTARGAGGEKALEHPDVPKPKHPRTPSGDEQRIPSGDDEGTPHDRSQKPEARSQKPEEGYSADFLAAWQEYPRRAGGSNKAGAYRQWKLRLKEGATVAEMRDGTKRYAAFCFATGNLNSIYVKDAATFYGRDKHYLQDFTPPDAAAGKAREGSEAKAVREELPRSTDRRSGPDLTQAEQKRREDQERVRAWAAEHPDEADALDVEVRREFATNPMWRNTPDTIMGAALAEAFNKRVLSQLQPRAVA